MKSKPSTVAGVIVHELIRYHVIRLARVRQLSRSEQDGIAEEVTATILSEASADEVRTLLVTSGLLLDDHSVEMRRLQVKLEIIKMMAASLKILREDIRDCPTYPRSLRQNQYDLFVQSLEIYEKEIQLHTKISTAEENAKDEQDYRSLIPIYVQQMQASCLQQ